MKCIKCNTEIEKGAKVCPNCGAKVTLNAKRVVAVVLALAVIVSGIAFAGWKVGWFSSQNTDSDISNDGFVFFADSFTDRKITDSSSALAAIGDVADLLGIADVNAEFTDCKVDTVSGNTYYRFYQEYRGIPVYGRSVVVVADGNGNSLMLSGNYVAPTNVSMDDLLSPSYIEHVIGEYIYTNCGTTEYSLQEVGDKLLYLYFDETLQAYRVAYVVQTDITGIGAYDFFVDAQTAEVIKVISLLSNDYDLTNGTVEKVNAKGQIENQELDVYRQYNFYLAADPSRNIELYKMKGSFFWFYSKNTNELEEVKWDISTHLSSNSVEIDALANIEAAYDYYKSVLKHSGTDGKGESTIYIFTDCGFYSDATNIFENNHLYGNASSGSICEDKVTAIYIGKPYDNDYALSANFDVMTHEYTHAVVAFACGLGDSDESSAINEGISDIFGELAEAWKSGSCDWIHGNRHLDHPEATGYPSMLSDISMGNEDFAHGRSTIISHTAYLMFNGISGNNPNFEALTTEDIAQLFYRTLYTLPSNCTFSQFRTLVQNTAEIMYQQGYPGFSYEKVRCVSNAFFQVGIDSATTPVSKEKLVLDIYDVTGQLYDNYTLYVRHSSGAEKKYTEKDVREGIDFPMTGRYEFYIEDNANALNHTNIYVNVIAQGGVTQLPVYTECGLSAIDTPISTTPSSESVQGNNVVPAFLSFHPFDDSKSQFLLSTYEITGGLRETNGKYGAYTNMPDFPFVASITDDFTHDGQMSSLSISMEDAKGGLDKHLAIHVDSASGGSHNYLLSPGNEWAGESIYYYLFKGVDSDYLVEEHLRPFSSSYDENNFYFGKEDGNRTEFIRIVSLTDFSEMKYEFVANMGAKAYTIREDIEPAEGSDTYLTLFAQDGVRYHYDCDAVFDSYEEATDYIKAKLSEIGLFNRIGGATNISESNIVPLFVVHREGIHDTVALSSADTLELTDTLYFGVNPDLSSGMVETAPESSQTSSIFGVWDSIDGEQRMIFTSKGTFAVSYENGIQDADGTAIIIDLQKGERSFGGFTTNGGSIILTIDMQQKSLDYSLSGDSLSIGGLSFRRVEKALANQLVGTWENNDGKFTFDDEGNVTVTHGSNYDCGIYAILSESEIMFNIDDNGASTYDYSVDGKTFSFGNQQYIKNGESSDYNEVTVATNTLVGTWKSDTMDDYYVFKSDGTYEYYAVEVLYQIGQVTTEGLYDIVSTSTIKVYQDMSGGFYSEFTLTDGVLTSSSYSPSDGGYIQYRKVE